jgi:uncharacterized protein
MAGNRKSRLRFNVGFLLEADLGSSRTIELDYPSIELEDDVVLAPLLGVFRIIRNSKGVYFTGTLHSKIEAECARCLEPVEVLIDIQLDDLFYYPPESAPPGEYPVPESGIVDLAPLVRQVSLLEIPMQPFCREDCQGLCVVCGQNLNHEHCDCHVEEIDPRLSVLRTLLDA